MSTLHKHNGEVWTTQKGNTTVKQENSNGFDPRVIDFTNEDAVFDRKQQLYQIDNLDSLKEFIKDIIALANSMRRKGVPAYLLFGVQDDRKIVRNDNGNLVGIQGQYIKKALPDNWNEESLDPQLQQEKIAKPLLGIISQHIGNHFDVEYETGFIQGALVSYLRISNKLGEKWIEKPFEVIKELKNKEEILLRPEDCWIRRGADNIKVEPHERDQLTCYRDVPFVKPSEWKTYLTSILSSETEVSLPVYCTHAISGEQHLLKSALLERLNDVLPKPQRILINNLPGCGKTTALQSLKARLANRALLAISDDLDEPPTTPIPIFLSLREYSFQHDGALTRFCLHKLDGVDTRSRKNPEMIFEDKDLVFVFILDGYDEMNNGNIQDNRKGIFKFVEHMKHHITITSCRSTEISNIFLPEGKKTRRVL